MGSFTTFLVTTSLMLLMIMAKIGEGGSVGINFGRQASQKLLPSMVVDMCLANGISKVKLFSLNQGVMNSFSGTTIELIVAIPNIELIGLVDNHQVTVDWMKDNIKSYLADNLNIRHLCIGVEPFSNIERDWRNDTKTIPINAVKVLKQIDKLIDTDNELKGKVKLGVPVATTVLEQGSKPSEGDFSTDYKEYILEVLPVLSKMDAPFMINIYPYFTITTDDKEDKMPLEFGLFDKRSNYTVTDGNLVYTNAFDLLYDTFVWALRKNGYGHLRIMVAQIGWPTDGGPGANIQNAKQFYDGLLKKVGSNQGTPLVPGADLEVYLYVLSDENQRRTDRGPYERHYGIYDADGIPKFNLDFTLQGRDIKPEAAQGVSYLPRRWCILYRNSSKIHNQTLLNETFNNACKEGDCTAFADGSSCSSLDSYGKVSYAFNSLFQMKNQEVLGDAACYYEGLGKVTNENPSSEGCDFPVQILSTLFINGLSNTEMIATLGVEDNYAGETLWFSYPLILTIPWLWILERWL